MVSRLDAHVGEIVQLLEDLNIDDNTIVFFTSDNGGQGGGKDSGWQAMTDFFQGNGPLRGYKGTFYEGGLRVPLIARWPGRIKRGATSDHICGFWDVLPTLAEIAGVSPPERTDGISFAPTLIGKGAQRRHKGIYWEYPRRGGIGRAARMARWKAIQLRPGGPVELYDLEEDIGETENLAAKRPAVVEKMLAFMDASHTPPRSYPKLIERATVDDYVR